MSIAKDMGFGLEAAGFTDDQLDDIVLYVREMETKPRCLCEWIPLETGEFRRGAVSMDCPVHTREGFILGYLKRLGLVSPSAPYILCLDGTKLPLYKEPEGGWSVVLNAETAAALQSTLDNLPKPERAKADLTGVDLSSVKADISKEDLARFKAEYAKLPGIQRNQIPWAVPDGATDAS